MRTTELTDKQARFIQLRADGWSYSDIAAELGISKGSCSNWAKRYAAEINKAAAKHKEQEAEPLPKATKKKAPRVIDITDKLSFDSDPDEPPDFIGRCKRGELTPKELEQFGNIFGNTLSKIGNEMREAYERFLIKAQIEETFTNSVDSVMEIYRSIFKEMEQRINAFVDSLPPDEKERLQAEIEKEQAAATRPKNITVLDACSSKTAKSKNSFATNNTQNLFQKKFAPKLTGNLIGNLIAINTTVKKPSVNKITGNATVKLDNGFVLSIENYDRIKREWKPSTIKLIHILVLLLTDGNHYQESNPDSINATVAFNVDDYMRLLNIPNTPSSRKEARAQIKKDLDTLSHSSIDWIERTGSKEKAYINTPILGGSYGMDKKGNVIATLSPQLSGYLIQDAYMMKYYSIELLKVDDRNANTYPLGYKLALHSNNRHNIIINTANILSVKKALEVCPNIPTIEELQAKGDRHWERRIKDPLEKALDSVPNLKWEYCNSKYAPLTDEQLADNSYSSFIGSYVHFEFIGAPDRTERLQEIAAEKKPRKRKPKSGTKRAAKNKETG